MSALSVRREHRPFRVEFKLVDDAWRNEGCNGLPEVTVWLISRSHDDVVYGRTAIETQRVRVINLVHPHAVCHPARLLVQRVGQRPHLPAIRAPNELDGGGGTADQVAPDGVKYDLRMGEFSNRTLARLPAGFELGDPLRMLLEWIEIHDFVGTAYNGDLYGVLDGRHRGPGVAISGYTPEATASYVHAWFRDVDDDPTKWLWPFAETGADGSVAALWIGVDGRTRFVHLGSGSGSLLTCVLAEDALDFVRLLAIGYDELCWPEDFESPPDEPERTALLRNWVQREFGVSVPRTASEIVRTPAELGDKDTPDAFCRLVNRLTL